MLEIVLAEKVKTYKWHPLANNKNKEIMNSFFDEEKMIKGIMYASSIIADVNTFMKFSVAMLDYMGEDFPYCRSIYSALSEWPDLKIKFQDYAKWKDITNGDVLNEYHRFKENQKEKNREQEFNDNIDELQFLVRKYRKSEEFQKMLDFVGKFHYLAPYNAMLVELQKPGATFVFNGKKWKEYNRRPKLNAQQLITLMPFGPVQCMFDYSDTEQIPNTNEVDVQTLMMEEWNNTLMKTKGKINNEILTTLIDNLVMYGIFFDDNFAAANTYGGYIMRDNTHSLSIRIGKGEGFIRYGSAFSISINKNQANAVKFHTLCHELGHLFCRHLFYDNSKSRSLTIKEREFEAETVAWLVCKRHGVDNPSEEYLAGYAPDGIIPICSTEYIMKAVTEIEKMLKPVSISSTLWYKEDKNLKEIVSKIKKNKD